ncbi:hypothetical protein BD309DRAFT_563544 [Dichomitus squalens]|nr:hypothetical protein BD309DRAFT_563544 [Dichomitus squalens]
MDNSPQYPPLQRQLFPSSTLPPPSQLHLNSFPRNNTLPPISQLPTASRYPPPTYTHPSLSSTASPLSGHSLSSSSTLPWSNQRSSRDDLPPPSRRLSDSSPHRPEREMARDSSVERHQSSHVKHEPEDSMPSTSDFVKKLYKCVLVSLHIHFPSHHSMSFSRVGCSRTAASPTSSRGVLMATASSSRT